MLSRKEIPGLKITLCGVVPLRGIIIDVALACIPVAYIPSCDKFESLRYPLDWNNLLLHPIFAL